LQKISEKIKPDQDKEAFSLTLAEIAFLKLYLSKTEECKELMDKTAAILDSITGADAFVYSSYYKVSLTYYKVKVAPTEFYKNSLFYLIYTPLEEIPLAEQQALAFDMGLAALVSTDIYNFGELLAHPILKSLEGTKSAWLKTVLFAFNAGDIAKYESHLNTYNAEFQAQPALKQNLSLLREKVAILALIELAFVKTSGERSIPFKVVAEATKLRVDEVELLLMKAMSLKLIKGIIDEVASTVTITWVQPRVLDLQQVGKMKERVGQWIGSVQEVLTFMQNSTAPELLT